MENILLSNDENAKAEYKAIMSRTVDAICESICDEKAYTGPEPFDLKKLVREETLLPDQGLGFEKTFELTKQKILPNLLRPFSTDYMPHLHGACTLESLSAEAIISAFNQSMDSWDQAPVATEIEVEVIRHLSALYGYGQGADGIFTSGGSQSNQTAIILARDSFIQNQLKYDVKKHGLPENFRSLRMYTSEISHFSMEKSAHILGLGYESVVKVPVDKNQKMDFNALKSLVEKDVSEGKIPFLLVCTAGTTDFGSIDPLAECSELCKKYNMWLHVDAAYGSGVIMSEKYKDRIAGIEKADSITVDFHKMFLQPISCSALLVKDGTTFDALTIHADYLNREEDEEDGYTNLVDKSLQTTRRFDALKVWMSFLCRGKDGWSSIITKSMENAQYFYKVISSRSDFETVCQPEISSVVFRSKAGDDVNKNVRRTLLHKYGIVIGQTKVYDKVFLKFTLLNPLMTEKKLDQLADLIEELCKQ